MTLTASSRQSARAFRFSAHKKSANDKSFLSTASDNLSIDNMSVVVCVSDCRMFPTMIDDLGQRSSHSFQLFGVSINPSKKYNIYAITSRPIMQRSTSVTLQFLRLGAPLFVNH